MTTTAATSVEALRSAQDFIAQGQLGEAERALLELLEIDPENPEALHQLGVVAYQSGQAQVALERMEAALKLDGSRDQLHNDLGVVLRALGRIDEAQASFERAAGGDPRLVDAHFNLGNIYRERGALVQAVESYRRASTIAPSSAQILTNLGLTFQALGRSQEAIDALIKAVRAAPERAVGHSNLAAALIDQGRTEEAILSLERALMLEPSSAQAHTNLAAALRKQGRIEASINACLAALRSDPELVEAHNTMGLGLRQLGRVREAASSFEMALMLEPGYAEAHRNLGLALREMGVLDQAEACFQRALQIDPSSADTYLDLGGAVAAQGRFDDAAACYLKAIKLEPTRMMAYNDLGLVLQEQGDLERAAQVFTKASSLDPSCTAVLVNLGRVLHQAGRSTEAIETYRQALRVDPSCAEAHNNLGASLSDIDEIDQAFEHYLEALRIEPEFKATHYNLAQLYHQIAQAESSIEHYQKILEIDPDYSDVLGNLFHQYQYACLWDKMELLSSRLDTAIPENSGEKRSIESPFVSIARSEDPRANLKVARSRIRAMERRLTLPTRPFGFDGARGRHQRLRLGYLSNDFHGHATMLLLAGLLSEHDDDRFEIFAYSHGPADESEHRMLLVERCKDFVDISKMSDLQAAERIHADGIDVLIDLKGHTFKSRLEICAFRPAPVQVTYLGFPGTTGADFFDYIIADRVVIPPEHEPYYSEKVVCLPHCYQANDGHRVISNASLERASQGLPEEGVVFCSFNQPYKIDPATFDRWMRILRQVPGSVLWLMKRAEITAESLRREAKSRAVDPNRLIFAPYLPNAEHLARLRLADLVLDTRIVNGHTTTSDALFVGVPVVAMLGGHFASRVSASLLRAVGLPELVAGDLDGYQALALELASDPSRLSQLRQRLEVTRLTSPLFDTPRFTRGFERALEMMWDIHEAGETARGFEVIEGE